jgi:hypothetical protein
MLKFKSNINFGWEKEKGGLGIFNEHVNSSLLLYYGHI